MGDQTAHAAANFKHALVGVDEIPIDLNQAVVIPASQSAPVVSFFCNRIPVRDSSLLIGCACFVEKKGFIHGSDFILGLPVCKGAVLYFVIMSFGFSLPEFSRL